MKQYLIATYIIDDTSYLYTPTRPSGMGTWTAISELTMDIFNDINTSQSEMDDKVKSLRHVPTYTFKIISEIELMVMVL